MAIGKHILEHAVLGIDDTPTLDGRYLKLSGGVMTGNLQLNDSIKLLLGTGSDGEIYSSSDNLYIANVTQDKDILFNVNDGGVTKTPLFIDGSSGNVGIGTTSPGAKLALADHTTSAGGILFGTDTNLYRRTSNVLKTDDTFEAAAYRVGTTDVITSGRIFRAADGSATAPAFSFSADTNTGIYRGGTDILRFSTAGADRMTILANGNVGIGTTSPQQKLEVAGNLLVNAGRLSVGTAALNSNFAIEAFANETATTGEKRALSFAIVGNPSADWGNTSILGLNGFAEHQANLNAVGAHFGGFFGTRNSGTSTLWISYGAFLEIQNTSTGTCDYAVATVASIKDTGGGKFTYAYGLLTQAEVASGGTIGSFYGAYLKNPTGAGAVTNNYALYIENQTKGGTVNYSIYSAGGANYFAGPLQTNAGFGCNTKPPQASYPVNAASSDLATVIALCNQLRAALIANGICV